MKGLKLHFNPTGPLKGEFSFEKLTYLDLACCFLHQPLSALSFLTKLYLRKCEVCGPIILRNPDCLFFKLYFSTTVMVLDLSVFQIFFSSTLLKLSHLISLRRLC